MTKHFQAKVSLPDNQMAGATSKLREDFMSNDCLLAVCDLSGVGAITYPNPLESAPKRTSQDDGCIFG